MHVPESQIDHSDETSAVPTDNSSIEIVKRNGEGGV